MSDLYARPDHWTDALPQSWQQSINTNPLLNALGRALNRQPIDLERAARDTYGTPEQQAEADRQWLIQKAQGPSWLERNPTAADGINKLGMLANFLGPGVKLPAAAPRPTGIRAYHGSPHDFDRFDINKIGTGEGAQAYGRGLYFAESEGVAKTYREALAGHGYDLSGASQGARVTMMSGRSIDGAIELAKRRNEPWIVKELEAIKAKGRDPKGRMYEVRINADPEQFLDWDKPLAQQPEAVRRAVEGMPQTEMRGSNGLNTPVLDREGDAFYHALAEAVGTPFDPKFPRRPERLDHNRATQLLRDAGIPGIKYLDQGSRAAGQGSRNYVVFDDKLIEILRKYGIWPLVPAGTAAALNQQEPPL